MAKAYYSDYVNHCLRFYARHNQPKFDDEIDELNWLACERVLNDYTDEDKNIVIEIFSDNNPRLADTITTVSSGLNIKPSRLWTLVGDVTRKIAVERNLIALKDE